MNVLVLVVVVDQDFVGVKAHHVPARLFELQVQRRLPRQVFALWLRSWSGSTVYSVWCSTYFQ